MQCSDYSCTPSYRSLIIMSVQLNVVLLCFFVLDSSHILFYPMQDRLNA
jgi:hypothetical protein